MKLDCHSIIITILLMLALSGCSKNTPYDDAIEAFKSDNPELAIKLATTLAERGDIDAELLLGEIYSDNWGVYVKYKDYERSTYWYGQAANHGSVEGEFEYGWSLLYGRGIKKDQARGWELIESSASKGYVYAELTMGKKYQSYDCGQFCKPDDILIPRDDLKSFQWYMKAAAQGNSEAQGELSRLYASSEVIARNYKEAIRWGRLAAMHTGELDVWIDQENLARLYSYKPSAAEYDPYRGYIWLYISFLAKNFGSFESAEADLQFDLRAKEIGDHLTVDEINKAKGLAWRCYKSEYQDCPF